MRKEQLGTEGYREMGSPGGRAKKEQIRLRGTRRLAGWADSLPRECPAGSEPQGRETTSRTPKWHMRRSQKTRSLPLPPSSRQGRRSTAFGKFIGGGSTSRRWSDGLAPPTAAGRKYCNQNRGGMRTVEAYFFGGAAAWNYPRVGCRSLFGQGCRRPSLRAWAGEAVIKMEQVHLFTESRMHSLIVEDYPSQKLRTRNLSKPAPSG
ncbi:hypothetical protein KSP40_PGU006335 [Platanthera guangdongensis]|uniref:Uncharacterized protein n=1 Tax=Platanthera guangdongensis TaxID=2320717 RepID=A0ABR2LFP9_9ASPA